MAPSPIHLPPKPGRVFRTVMFAVPAAWVIVIGGGLSPAAAVMLAGWGALVCVYPQRGRRR